MELDAGTQPALEQIERLGGADVVVGILDPEQREAGSASRYCAQPWGSGLR